MKKKTQKQQKFHVRKGDQVRVIAGNHKNSEGEVLRVHTDTNRAVVEGVNLRTRHRKPTAQNPEGALEEFEAPIHLSNLMVINPETGEPARTGRRRNEETGKLERYFKEKKANQQES